MFRGTLFELAERSFPGNEGAPVWITSVFFSLQHFQLHGYRADRAALTQVAFTFPMGLVFATLRRRSQSLWPAFVVHILTNLPSAFGK
jgi:membrane protease YdiL (CAAX protease family)